MTLEWSGPLEYHEKKNTMMTPEMEEFARVLIRSVRDMAIQSCDQLTQPKAASAIARRWQALEIDEQSAATLVADCVDETVFHLLQAIYQGLLPLTFKSASGKTVDLAQDGLGELSGWYVMSGGWRAQNSEERFCDDFADLER